MSTAAADRPSGPAPPRRRRRSRVLTGPLAVLALVASLLAVPAATSPDTAEAAHGDGWTQISAGYDHTCAIDADDLAWCWGDNSSGQLGDGTTTDRTTPTRVSVLEAVADISAGQDHTCAVGTAGRTWCWGDNTDGQLGDGTTTDRTTPTRLTDLPPAIDVSAGGGHTCAAAVDDDIDLADFPLATDAWCWGASYFTSATTPETLGYEGASAVSAGHRPTCIIVFVSSRLACSFPELDYYTSGQPFAVSAGGEHACAISVDRPLMGLPEIRTSCWGINRYGQIGDGTTGGTHWWATPVSDAEGTTVISAGFFHTCAATNGSAPYCWGANGGGQLGDGTTTDRNTPTPVSGLEEVVDISAGGSSELAAHSCAIDDDGAVWCWGDNTSGQLGDGTTTDRTIPTLVSAPSTDDLIEIVPGVDDASDECQAAGGDRVIDSTTEGVRTFVYVHQPTSDEVWLCARVEDTSTGDGYGGRLEATPTDVDRR